MKRIALIFLLSATAFAAPAVTLSSAILTFGSQLSGTTSAGQVVTMTNTGSSTLNITSITVTGSYPAFFTRTTTCGVTLAAGAPCTITVTFSPTYYAPVSANVTIITNASPTTYTIAMTGIGTPSGMLLYPGGATHPTRQISCFGCPINISSPGYSHFIGAGTVLGNWTAGQYLTSVTHSMYLGCTAANCLGPSATYIDHVNATGGIAGGACPALVFSTGTNPIDQIFNSIASLGYINNFILYSASYGGPGGKNTITPQYLWTQDWSKFIDNDCLSNDLSLTHQTSHPYMPGDYILVGSTYLQTQTGCGNADANDDSCTSASISPACLPTTTTIGTTCLDGSVTWVSRGTVSPPLHGWCDINYPGTGCYSLPINGTVTVSGSNVTVTVTGSPSWDPNITVDHPIADAVNVTGTGGSGATNYDCTSASGCTVTAVTSNTVTYTLAGKSSGSTSTGTISGGHAVSINSPNGPNMAMLQTTLPIPYEQPMRQHTAYIYDQFDKHYRNSVGYIRAFGTKGGEMAQDGFSPHGNFPGWPWYFSNQFTTYEKYIYIYAGNHGGGTDFAGMGNLNTNPAVEAAYLDTNSLGFDNNAQGTNHAYTLDCYSSPSAATACGATYTTGIPPAGKLYHGGDWALMFSTYNHAQGNGKFPVTTLQTTQASTPGSTPGSCSTGTCANGSCTTAGPGTPPAPITGAMSQDTGCSNSTFPLPNGYPGVLPLGKQYLENNEEMYFCDAVLGLDPSIATIGAACSIVYPTVPYTALYKAAFQTFLSGANSLPVFTSTAAAGFSLNLFNTFTVSTTGTPIPTITLTSGSLPTGVTLVDNGNGTATLSGTPTVSGTSALTFTATNTAGSVNQNFTLKVIGVNVQGTGSGSGNFVIGFSGTLFANLDDTLTGWAFCALACAGGNGNSSGVTQTINNTAQSVDGHSMLLTMTGPALGGGLTTNELWYYKPGAHNAALGMVGSYSIFVPSMTIIAALEFDQFIFTHSPTQTRFMFGSECDIGAFWRIWNQLTASWVATTTPCTINVGSWNTIQWNTHRVSGDTSCSGHACMFYDLLTVNGVQSGPYTAQPSNTSSDADNVGIQFQIDMNNTGGTTNEYLDLVNLTIY